MDLGQRYHGSKGVPAYKVEDGVLGILALPGDLEENASHHFMGRYHGSKGVPDSIVEDWVLGNLAPPGDLEESASHHFRCPMLTFGFFQGFLSSASIGVDTIGKSVKNYGDYCRVCFISCISWGDIMGQSGSRTA